MAPSMLSVAAAASSCSRKGTSLSFSCRARFARVKTSNTLRAEIRLGNREGSMCGVPWWRCRSGWVERCSSGTWSTEAVPSSGPGTAATPSGTLWYMTSNAGAPSRLCRWCPCSCVGWMAAGGTEVLVDGGGNRSVAWGRNESAVGSGGGARRESIVQLDGVGLQIGPLASSGFAFLGFS